MQYIYNSTEDLENCPNAANKATFNNPFDDSLVHKAFAPQGFSEEKVETLVSLLVNFPPILPPDNPGTPGSSARMSEPDSDSIVPAGYPFEDLPFAVEVPDSSVDNFFVPTGLPSHDFPKDAGVCEHLDDICFVPPTHPFQNFPCDPEVSQGILLETEREIPAPLPAMTDYQESEADFSMIGAPLRRKKRLNFFRRFCRLFVCCS